MKWLLLLILFMPIAAFSADMCVRRDAVMVAMDPLINGSANGSNATGKTWSAKFSWGVISGIGACNGDGGTQGHVATNQNMSVYSTGSYCYCKMLRPVQSLWVYTGKANSSCASICASICASEVASAVVLRRGLFRSVHDL